MKWMLYVAVGVTAGIVGGFFGLGGGVVMVPALLLICGLTQHEAQGTALAIMIPPIGLLAAMRYYASGNVRVDIAVLTCIGFFLGGYFGANLAHLIPGYVLRKAFGLVLMFVSLKLILGR